MYNSAPMNTQKQTKVLIILDGWGHSEVVENNAVALARTPVWDKFNTQFAHTLISTSGKEVGLPGEQMGNSEVGHLNLGAGRIVKQDFTRIQNEIGNGDFFRNPILKNSLEYANDNSKAVHIMGLLSDGGVHSHEEQMYAMLEMSKQYGCQEVYLHIFADGRDCAQKSAKNYILKLEDKITEFGIGEIASVIGRYFSLDRDNRWSRVRCAYELIAKGKGAFLAQSAVEAIDMAYERGETDEFVQSTVIKAPTKIQKGDVMIFMNYRADRARQITQAFTDESFQGFSRGTFVPIQFVCLTEYKKEFNLPVVYPAAKLNNVLGKYLSNLGMTQLRIAETEKYAHVTFFLNGGIERPFYGEDRILIPSPDVATYDLKPEMSIFELTDELAENIESQKYDLIICNFANTDMVGHSGKLGAAIKAVEAVDTCLGIVYQALRSINGEMLITADHGNVEQMVNPETGEAHTAHTNNPVPLLFISDRAVKIAESGTGALSDIAPTLLLMMDIEQPDEMTGSSLITFN
ncbi:2,3-bisphosphoglycerate-independent phosphoglycerate mutase (EC 5.4.2.12) [uncultured Gammaproteobacteria bacterium]|jgi:2,3-bisphosphoglycerate-independent phosphoglycerate mutase|nr:2,3-bisphosphoglycerate-independent phosphoglycerate mutase (EC 5.4.2.12) [uncultured Gammaproteobacteria bacterium]CAC9563039.1 2,3-bisphosphoglycerate-independent phosphoglycerate mutase (EC 5.4.2.12) [uncultured Gammaproteobacteria bacterium]CAC9564972.1 2,3-bisphosphoglycerate-independent phosphoglycerate mutase (EC 5.4.2.12) [uncultured Gammaproteobacteria bacterium]CAC9574940.1 2,3-bisphosphoglycerate-independent phosphoglycerate mutase (EC 5.4.2.12) [uncultured Gammaproteobacteria bact